jgi:hypothetical protein
MTGYFARLEVREIIGDYRQVGVSWDGGTVLAGPSALRRDEGG